MSAWPCLEMEVLIKVYMTLIICSEYMKNDFFFDKLDQIPLKRLAQKKLDEKLPFVRTWDLVIFPRQNGYFSTKLEHWDLEDIESWRSRIAPEREVGRPYLETRPQPIKSDFRGSKLILLEQYIRHLALR